MAESSSRSRLKRKKSSAEELQSNTLAPWRGRPAMVARDRSEHTDRSAAPAAAAAWWSRHQLPAVERLWALTLSSALACMEKQHWDPLPDLPHPCETRASAAMSDEQRWCDLSADIPPFPEPSAATSGADVLSFTSSQQTEAAAGPLLCSHSAGLKPPQLQLHLHPQEEEVTMTAEPPEAEADKRDMADKLLQMDSKADGSNPLQEEEEVVEDREEDESRSNTVAGGAEGLQSCPMCLQEFPAGFTQMDCDGHLAQCLSEMNVDMTW